LNVPKTEFDLSPLYPEPIWSHIQRLNMNIRILMNPSASGLMYVRGNGFWCSRDSSAFLPFCLFPWSRTGSHLMVPLFVMPVPVVMQSHGVVNTLVTWNIIDYALEQALVELLPPHEMVPIPPSSTCS
jgi:hypothetical protein